MIRTLKPTQFCFFMKDSHLQISCKSLPWCYTFAATLASLAVPVCCTPGHTHRLLSSEYFLLTFTLAGSNIKRFVQRFVLYYMRRGLRFFVNLIHLLEKSYNKMSFCSFVKVLFYLNISKLLSVLNDPIVLLSKSWSLE